MLCPFCNTPTTVDVCPNCHRSITGRRRPCPSCQKMSPVSEPKCCHCQKPFGSDLSWKIPLIIGLFVAALVLSVIINLVAQ